jgi:4-amino-4-deoxy-L-arabinose transferase-like glycosyltransferase
LGGILFALSTRGIVFTENAINPNFDREKIGTSPKSRWIPYAATGGGLLIFLLISLFLFDANLFDTFAWIISIGAFLIATFWWDRAAGTSLKINLTTSEIVQLMLIVILGLIIGVYQLTDVPNLLMGDEGSFFETARSIALGTYRPSPFDLGVYSYPVLSSIWQGGVLKLFGITLWGWRFSSVLPAVFTVIPLYLLARDLFGRGVGIISALVLLVTPYFLAFSRLGYNNSQSIFIVTLCIWLVYTGSKKGSAFFSFLGGVVAGLGFLTYTAGRLGFVVAILYFFVLIVARITKANSEQHFFAMFVSFVVGLVVFASPHMIHNQKSAPEESRFKMLEGLFFQVDYGKEFFEEDALFEYASPIELDEHEFFYNPQIYKALLVRGLARTLLAFHLENLVSEHFIAGNFAGPLATVFYTLGGFLVLGRLRDRRFLLIAIWFFSGLFFLSVINTYPPRHQHLVPVIPAVAIMIGLGVMAFTRQLAALLAGEEKSKLALQFAIAVVIVIALGVTGLRAYFVVMPAIYRPNLEQVMNWFGLYNSPEANFVLIHAEPVDEKWRPYLFRELLGEHKFTLVDAVAFLDDEKDLQSISDLAIFYYPENAEQVVRRLQRIFPDARTITFYDRDQKPVAEAVIQGKINIPASASFFKGLLNVFRSPVIWILIPLLLLLGAYWITHQQDLTIRPLFSKVENEQSSQFDTETNAPSAMITKNPSRFFEIGFFIRFVSRDSIRRFEPKLSVRFDKEEFTDTPKDDAN